MSKRSPSPKAKWEARYSAGGYDPDRTPVPLLEEAAGQTDPGSALCLAAGCGRNAVFLAERGFAVTAVDISARGLEWCRQLAAERGVRVNTVEADLLTHDLDIDAYDLITEFYYYEPALFPSIKRAVKPRGLFAFQTFSIRHLGQGWGPQDPNHLARPEVVQQAFADWSIRVFDDCRETRRKSNGEESTEAVVRLLAQKPP